MHIGLRLVRAAIAAAAVLCAPLARAVDVVPAPESGPPLTKLTVVNKKLELRDVRNGKLILQERNALPLVQSYDPQVTYTLKINEQPTGYDMVVTFTNDTNQPRRPGAIYVGMLTLGSQIEYLDVRHTSVWRPVNFSTFVGKGYTYPDDLFSPVFVVRNGEYAVAASLRYPAVELNHDARVAIMNPSGSNSGEGGQGWGAGFRLANPDNVPPTQAINHPGILPPKTSRTYVVAVRVVADRDDWMRTLLPYRKYFRDLYGGVSFKRKTYPILPVGIADGFYQEAGNLSGFGDPNIRRPDVFGWGPWADELSAIEGYGAVMLWAPSGLYFFNPQHNYPFQITSQLEESPLLSTAFDPQIGLPRVRESGKTLGLWWGRSLDISLEWDSPDVIPLDPNNPLHVQIAERELDGAVRAGVNLIGLDTCNPRINGIANAYHWVKHIRERYPSITFIAEPSPCDILSTLVGGVLPGWALDGEIPKTISDCYPFQNPHYLADFLIPGHEMVMSYRYNFHKDFFNHHPTPQEVDADMRWFASMGYVPMVWEQISTGGDVRAAESWTWTVPGGLR
ncbi:MAG TPA: hypothetical protein VK176_07140, partial [Phycisphaerales bacterium]|nr:hypothetical protein [Phycisphaerales bacterium]